MNVSLYPCAMCGKPFTATDQLPYCGGCESGYQQEKSNAKEERRRNAPKCASDCDAPHCKGCGAHYERTSAQRIEHCDECSM